MPLGEVGISLDNGLFWTTGGGFADYPARPSYQSKFVQTYLDIAPSLPPKGAFNANGRAYPDVSAIGHKYVCRLILAYSRLIPAA